ncbi:MAG TPA: hypothetical protein VNE82_10425, partial [Candidatus Binataceae bacterium]|nr:hypothetical protein [Candidatus Binataceae bacterium]
MLAVQPDSISKRASWGSRWAIALAWHWAPASAFPCRLPIGLGYALRASTSNWSVDHVGAARSVNSRGGAISSDEANIGKIGE